MLRIVKPDSQAAGYLLDFDRVDSFALRFNLVQLETKGLFRDRAWFSAKDKYARRECQSLRQANWVVTAVGVRLEQHRTPLGEVPSRVLLKPDRANKLDLSVHQVIQVLVRL